MLNTKAMKIDAGQCIRQWNSIIASRWDSYTLLFFFKSTQLNWIKKQPADTTDRERQKQFWKWNSLEQLIVSKWKTRNVSGIETKGRALFLLSIMTKSARLLSNCCCLSWMLLVIKRISKELFGLSGSFVIFLVDSYYFQKI